ncbi:MAG: glycosyl hydrolase [Flavobacteriaceae bacterium]
MNFRLITLLLCISQFVFAQNAERIFKSIENKEGYLEVVVNDGVYKITPYSSKIIETTFIPNGQADIKKSHAVVLKPEKIRVIPKRLGNRIVYATPGIKVVIQIAPFKISYLYKRKELVSEKMGYLKKEKLEAIEFNITTKEVLYGGGARALGMNRRGKRLQLYNKAHYGYQTQSELMNFTLPIVASSNMYMIHFDNAPIGYLDLDSKKENTLSYETISGRKTYQVIAGDSWLDIVNSYTDLTGKQPLPPRWVLGNFSSRFGYHSQNETTTTIAKFKQDSIPVDAIILDLYWFGKDVKGTMGNLSVYKDSFPDMKGMVSKLKDQGVKTVLITEPFILTSSNRWEEAVKGEVLAKDSLGKPFKYDFYFGNTGLIDIYNPKGEQWFWNRYKEIHDLGVQGLWGDLGEPEVHPSKLVHATGTADEVHNIYGHDWARLIFEGYQKDYPNERPFILMRAGYSGSQRYGMIPWSGDVSRSWGGLQSQPEISLQMGMQGIGYMHSDLGGFAGANLDDELYARWLQYGVFQPIFRPHAQEDVASEPVFRSAKAKALAKEAIELRYKLLPYNYTLAYHNHISGAPLMRPLFFEEPTKNQLKSLSSTYLWGIDFLISPVTESKEQTLNIYFPEGSAWFDFYTDAVIEGGITSRIATKENSIPTFVRGGAFIPMAYPMQHTEEYNPDKIQLHYYHDPTVYKSRREMYNDDGVTANALEKGLYEKLFFQSDIVGLTLDITLSAEIGENFNGNPKEIELIIHNVQEYPKSIKVNKRRVEAGLYKKQLKLPIKWDTKEKMKIRIKLKS